MTNRIAKYFGPAQAPTPTLGPPAPVLDVGAENFISEASEGNVLLDFYAPWCGPCRKMNPAMEVVARQGVKVAKIDISTEVDLANHFSINAIPAFIALKDGVVVGQTVGVHPAPTLLEMFK